MSAARADRAGSAFGRLGAATAANPAPAGPARSAASPRPPRAEKVEPVQRFTIRFYDQSDVDGLDIWLLNAKRQLGQKVDKARLVRELLRLLTHDYELTAQVYERLKDVETS